MKGKIVLVTGGARSGKSSFAERYVTGLGTKVAYIATAQVLDDEMAQRVSLHRERRPDDWLTYEAPVDVSDALVQAMDNAEAVMVDCLTLYVSNLLLGPGAPDSLEERAAVVQYKVADLLKCAKAGKATVVFVTNEVGQGIVPDNALAREYRDVAGLVNQAVAAVADEVYLVVCGVAVELKKNAIVLN
ncbi:MAG: Adenosylcobinamide-phosphate guanylyltransferase [Firmicutes bacterium]|nr:Adenosylcobinamide-phosphate guanylyltransferase [Bacillota bacterium]